MLLSLEEGTMAFGPVLELSSLNGVNGFQINGETALDFSGASVSSAPPLPSTPVWTYEP